ncbi:M14 family zinc carboxypeptidase [Tenacibaculum piscium]|uniref:M14 family zinc carboxypeptidase n=1 Tax=Tenacibaculum piscium TaxID=1458515 RepID=UPI001F2BD90E|nr:M14 family zinc carboxypeptidase [Tenacibaculum piscium]
MNTNTLNIDFLEENYQKIKQSKISGRYITLEHIKPIIEEFSNVKIENHQKIYQKISANKIGESEQGKDIYQLKIKQEKIGNLENKKENPVKILIWSQMHGNESTGTKAVFDFLNFLKNEENYQENKIAKTILENCEITIIPILNPDGAEVYTRVNANNIDLNRDAVDLKAKESKLLRKILDTVNPDFCFNLHDQRTIFGVEGTRNPATISFLAPSEEITRKITEGRKKTMNVIIAMNELLQEIIPNHIGRYTDEFYPTATGDTFQKLGYNTILIEAGHFPNDYERENVRKFNFFALLQGIYHLACKNNTTEHQEYFAIPNNIKNFYDVIYRTGNKTENNHENNQKDVAFQYVEKVENGKFAPTLKKEKEGDLSSYIGHKELRK